MNSSKKSVTHYWWDISLRQVFKSTEIWITNNTLILHIRLLQQSFDLILYKLLPEILKYGMEVLSRNGPNSVLIEAPEGKMRLDKVLKYTVIRHLLHISISMITLIKFHLTDIWNDSPECILNLSIVVPFQDNSGHHI